MLYSQIVSCYETPVKFEGRTLFAVHAANGFAAFRFENDEIFSFTVEEIQVGKWFEVFPIRLDHLASDLSFAWTELEAPIVVAASEKLWREEWQEPTSDTAGFMGSGPHSTQFAAALGTAPKSNRNVVKVLAGIKLTGQDGRSVLVCSSENTPFKVNLAADVFGIEHVMQFHTTG